MSNGPWIDAYAPDRRAVLAGLIAAGFVPSMARAAQSVWRTEASLPAPVQEVYGAAYRGEAVLVGGMVQRNGRSAATDRVVVFSPATGSWRDASPLPSPRHHPIVAASGESLYAIGGARHGLPGEPAGEHWRAQTDVFVLRDGRWSRGPALPMPQTEGVALVVGDRIHLLTGRTPKSPAASRWADYRDVDFHQVLDVRTGSWSHAAPAPAPRNSATAGVIDGRLYIAGGRTMDGGNMARLDMYDPQTDRWQSLRPMPAPAGGLAGAVFAGELYVFGGEELGREDAGGVIAESWKYSPARDAWTALPDMPTPRHGLAAVALEDRILLAGGGALPATGRTMTTVESFRPG